MRALAEQPPQTAEVTIDCDQVRSPPPRPRQIFGVGVNYTDHGAEADMAVPEVPLIFTKLSTAVTGPFGPIALSTKTVDWEVEIAVVIGRPAQAVAISAAWDFRGRHHGRSRPL